MKERREKISRTTAVVRHYVFFSTENHSQNAKKCYHNLFKLANRSYIRFVRRIDRDFKVKIAELQRQAVRSY